MGRPSMQARGRSGLVGVPCGWGRQDGAGLLGSMQIGMAMARYACAAGSGGTAAGAAAGANWPPHGDWCHADTSHGACLMHRMHTLLLHTCATVAGAVSWRAVMPRPDWWPQEPGSYCIFGAPPTMLGTNPLHDGSIAWQVRGAGGGGALSSECMCMIDICGGGTPNSSHCGTSMSAAASSAAASSVSSLPCLVPCRLLQPGPRSASTR